MLKNCLSFAVLLSVLASAWAAIPHCETLGTTTNGTSICVKCNDGYYVNASASLTNCYPCETGCEDCGIINNKYICTDCNDGFRLDTNTSVCFACAAGCEECSPTKCTECHDEFSLQNDGTCKQSSRSWGTIIIWILVVAALGVGGYFAYNKYFANQREGVGAIDYENAAYKAENGNRK